MADRKIDFEYIKQQIDTDQIISIMDSLGVPVVKQDNKQKARVRENSGFNAKIWNNRPDL